MSTSDTQDIQLDSVERAIADIAAGKAVVVVDDEDRENEGRPHLRGRTGHPGTDGLHGSPQFRLCVRGHG